MSTVILDLTPTKYHLKVPRGSDFTLGFSIVDSSGRAVDVSADDLTLTVRDGYKGDIKFSVDSLAGAHFNGAGGLVEFDIDAADTDTDSKVRLETEWVYEVRLFAGGVSPEAVYFQGKFIVEPAVDYD